MIRIVISILLLPLWCVASTFYAATNGAAVNIGTIDSPWPLGYAVTNAGASNTIIVLPGKYYGQIMMVNPYTTLQASQKWGSLLYGATNSPGEQIGAWGLNYATPGTVIDGFEINGSWGCGIYFVQSNTIVRNCWVHGCGTNESGSHFGTGIALHGPNNSVSNCLSENNGLEAGIDHGIYVGGTNDIVSGNVCRYNVGFGIQLYEGGGPVDQCYVQNNLCYSNAGSGGIAWQLAVYHNGTGTNYVLNNTCVTPAIYAMLFAGGTIMLTNNIILSTGTGIQVSPPATTFYRDYNLSSIQLAYHNTHDVVSSAQNFVDISRGLYWLIHSSPGVGKSLSGGDIGAYPYSVALYRDPRTLDPSPAAGSDYWTTPTTLSAGASRIYFKGATIRP
jgi:hypothetical protein